MSAPKGERYPVQLTLYHWIMGVPRVLVRLPFILLSLLVPWFLLWLLMPLRFVSHKTWTQLRRPVVMFAARVMIRVAGVRLEIRGTVPQPPFFLVANHLSWLDGPVFMAGTGAVFIVQDKIRKWFFLGSFMKSMGNMFIDKQNLRDLPQIISKVGDILTRSDGFIAFPEADTADGEIEPICTFKPALFEVPIRLGVRVHRAAIHYTVPQGWPPASRVVAWADWTPLVLHVIRMLMVPSVHCTLEFLPPELPAENRKEEAQKTQNQIYERLTGLRHSVS